MEVYTLFILQAKQPSLEPKTICYQQLIAEVLFVDVFTLLCFSFNRLLHVSSSSNCQVNGNLSHFKVKLKSGNGLLM